MSADLHALSDAQLSEVFAVEVAAWHPTTDAGVCFGLDGRRIISVPPFSTSVDALLPFIGVRNIQLLRTLSTSWNVWVASVGDVNAPTLARALCIALILAARVEVERDRARHRFGEEGV